MPKPQECEGENVINRSTLPVTGWEGSPVLEDDGAESKDIDVETFVLCPVGIKFYKGWLQGKISCRLIGQRFGYGVLGKFYAIKDESERLMETEHVLAEEAEELARATMAGATAQVIETSQAEGHPPARGLPRDAGLDPPQSVHRAEGDDPPQDAQRCEGLGLDESGGAASSSDVTVGSVSFAAVIATLVDEPELPAAVESGEPSDGVSESRHTAESTAATSESSGRQTSLEHWLK